MGRTMRGMIAIAAVLVTLTTQIDAQTCDGPSRFGGCQWSKLRGFKDFWPQASGAGGAFGGQFGIGTAVENGQEVSKRAMAWFEKMSLKHGGKKLDEAGSKICILETNYVLYTMQALVGRDQTQVNAPLVVERRVGKDAAMDVTNTNIEVWRYGFVTDDQTLFDDIMGRSEEKVVGAAGRPGLSVAVMVAAVTAVLALLI